MAEREVGDNLNRDTNLRKERHQEGPSGSLNLSDYKLHERAEETETHNESLITISQTQDYLCMSFPGKLFTYDLPNSAIREL
ncbi:hypothetical protein G5I_09298 [Acromyrmex echinatior]|uniref:Uncharacterized protein n=1 Tax=Acromyrmex echinatior TaxID=103372 RepID=F4WTU7_ACREC|nr:hypothetical protein G5I_09298 [Acromyrmex echinatior]